LPRKIIIEPELLWALYYGNDYTKKKISDILDYDWVSLWKKFGEYEIPSKPNLKIEPELLWALYWGNDYSMEEIGRLFNCSYATIRLRMTEFNIPRITHEEIIKRFTKANIGKRGWNKNLTKETDTRIKRISDALIGHTLSEDTKDKIRKKAIGRKQSPETIQKRIDTIQRTGVLDRENNPAWRGGIWKRIKDFRSTHRKEEGKWRISVYQNDNYTCRICGEIGGNLNAHHILPYAKFPDDRFNVDNGMTLCVECHKKLHKHEEIRMLVDFDEWKRIHEAIKGASDLYQIKSFKPWESDGGKQYMRMKNDY